MTFSVIGDSFRLDRVARKANQDRKDMGEVPPTHPLVEVHARKAHEDEINGGARQFGRFLANHGFTTIHFVYSKGTRIHAKSGKPIGAATSTISVRAYKHDGATVERVVGLWYLMKSGWETQGAWRWMHGELPKNYGVEGVMELVAGSYSMEEEDA